MKSSKTNFACSIKMFLSVLVLLFLSQSIDVVAESAHWRINAWGSVSPTTEFQEIDEACSRNSTSSSSFKVISHGDGDSDANLVFSEALKANQAYRFTGWLRSERPTSVEIFFRRENFPYDVITTVSKKIFGWTYVSVEGIHTSPGAGSVRIAIKEDNLLLCINSPSLAPIDLSVVGAQNSAAYIDEKFFGVHLNRLGTHNGWPNFDPGTLRLWDTATTWAGLQPTMDPIDWLNNPSARRLDYYVRHGQSMHPNLQFIYTLGMTPEWAGRTHRNNCSNSSYGPSVCTLPSDIEYWRKYVRELGVRYKGIIQIWELWNEADLWYQWDQKPEEMVLMAQIAATELKSIDPSNQLIGPNITVGGLGFLNNFLLAGGADYIDGISIHANPDRISGRSFAQLRNLRWMLQDLGLSTMPIWNTEAKVFCQTLLDSCIKQNDDGDSFSSGEDALAQGLIGNAALGVKSFDFYTWEGTGVEQGNVALVDDTFNAPTKAGLVFGTVKKWLLGSTVSYLITNQVGLNIVEVRRDNARSFIAWTSGGAKSFRPVDFGVVDSYMAASDSENHLLTSEAVNLGDEPMIFFLRPR